MSLLLKKNKFQEKIEANFSDPINIVNKKENKSDFSKELDKISNSTLLIGEGVSITGNIKAENEVIVQGVVEGDIECIKINVNHSGKVIGNIKTNNMTVEGYIEGSINVKDILTIKSSGNINGKLEYDSIQIDNGGRIEGELIYKDKNIKQEEFKDWKAL